MDAVLLCPVTRPGRWQRTGCRCFAVPARRAGQLRLGVWRGAAVWAVRGVVLQMGGREGFRGGGNGPSLARRTGGVRGRHVGLWTDRPAPADHLASVGDVGRRGSCGQAPSVIRSGQQVQRGGHAACRTAVTPLGAGGRGRASAGGGGSNAAFPGVSTAGRTQERFSAEPTDDAVGVQRTAVGAARAATCTGHLHLSRRLASMVPGCQDVCPASEGAP